MSNKNSLDELLALDKQTGFSKKGQGSAGLDPVAAESGAKVEPDVSTPGKASKVAPVKKAASSKKANQEAVTNEADLYPWMTASDSKADFLLKMPLDMKLLLSRVSRLKDDKASMTSVALDCIKKELTKLAKEHGLPIPKSLKDV